MQATVLLVGPDLEPLRQVEYALRRESGIHLLRTTSPDEALAVLSGQEVDAVVATGDLDEPDGAGFIEEVGRRFPRVARLAIADGEDGEAAERRPQAAMSVGRLERPWTEARVRAAVKATLRERAIEREIGPLRASRAVSEAQLERARRVALQLERPKPIGEILVELGQLARAEYERFLAEWRRQAPIAEILLEQGALAERALRTYREAKQREPDRSDRAILVDGGLVTEEQYLKALCLKHDIPYIEPEVALVDPSLLARASIPYLLRHKVLPLRMENGVLTAAVADPTDTGFLGDLERVFGAKVSPCCACSDRIVEALHTLERLRSGGGSAAATSLQYHEIQGAPLEDDAGEGAIQIVDYLLLRSIELGASDLHIEPLRNKVRVRARVDGMLRPLTDLPADFAPRVASRVKILSGADIAERRLHQDGRIFVRAGGRDMDIRVSTYASMFGETLVLRLLDRKRGLLPLEELCFHPRALVALREVVLRASSGMILVTGPTGCGKTTTLYSFVDHLNDPSLKVISCEDPVEYVLDGVVQCSVNEKTGPTFADSLRAIVRQDPDVIVVGEIRDRETAALAVEAALTGHKVLSTLHTEDSVGAAVRLLDMGIEPYLVSSTLGAVVAQRLVREVCLDCRRSADPSREDLKFLGLERSGLAGCDLVQGAGCPRCGGAGFRGRLGIHEVLVPDDDFRDAILRRAPSRELRALARRTHAFLSLQEDGVLKAIAGRTTLGEIVANAPRDGSPRPLAQLKEAAWTARF